MDVLSERRRALMGVRGGPSNGFVNGVYPDRNGGSTTVTNGNTFTLDGNMSYYLDVQIPLIESVPVLSSGTMSFTPNKSQTGCTVYVWYLDGGRISISININADVTQTLEIPAGKTVIAAGIISSNAWDDVDIVWSLEADGVTIF